MYTCALSVDEYGRPTAYKDKAAIRILLIQLILLNPGTFQSHPNMGVGLVKRYRYSFMENISSIKLEIENQIETYLPMLQGVSVDIEPNPDIDKEIIIYITIEDTLYPFTTNDGKLSDL